MITSGLIYWSTMAQVSATFVALIFAGLSVFLGNIRSAIREAHLKHPLKENSSNLMYAAMWSNFCLFVLPLITSLGIILEQEHPRIRPIFFWSFIGILGVILILNLLLYWKKATREERNSLRDEVRLQRKILSFRILLGSYGIPAIVILYGVIMFFVQRHDVAWLLSIFLLASIAIGLGAGIFDLVAFDASNILFKTSETFSRHIRDRERVLKDQLAESDYLYERWKNLASDHKLFSKMSRNAKAAGWGNEFVKEQLNTSYQRMNDDYRDFKKIIESYYTPKLERFRFAERILSSKEMLTLQELQQVSEEMERLLEAATTFHKYLSDRLDRWEKWSREN